MAAETRKRRGIAETVERYPSLERLKSWGQRRRIPFVQQLSATECGAACLAMVLGYHGRNVGVEEVRDVCGGSRDGITARALLTGAEKLGLRGRGVKAAVEDLELLPAGATILHWEFSHFVVLSRVGARAIEILDPAVGRRQIPIEEFRRSFTGVALTFEPNNLFRKQERQGIVLATVKQLLVQSGTLPRILVISLALQVFGLAMPMLMGQLIDRILPRGDFNLLVVIMSGFGVMIVFEALAVMVRGNLFLHLRTVLDVQMTLGFLDHLVSLPYAYFQSRGAGDLMMRLNSNAEIRERLTSSTLSVLLDGALVLVYLALLFVGNTTMAAAALIAGALDVGVYLFLRRRQHELMTQGLATEAKSQSYQVEMLTSMETLKATGNEHRAVSHWSNLFVDSLNVVLDRERLSIRAEALLNVLRAAGPLVILSAGAMQVMKGSLSLGAMLSLNAVAASFLGPLSSLVQTALSLDLLRSYLERVNDVLHAAPEQDPEQVRAAPRLTGQVELERVSFRYGAQAPLVVDDLSLRLDAGQFVAIVGRSGSGKSTLAGLILGLHRPQSGRIRFDGVDLGELELRSVRQQFGIVNQNFALFGTTIRENIALSDPTLTLDEVSEAARQAVIHEEIMAMPLNYGTPLVDRGGALSGGQKQRLALARALVRRPAVLLLDEATSALDAVTERQVQHNLQEMRCTRIVIAHRLSTVKRADLILVMEKGRVVEQGTHDSLLAKGGHYARLVSSQMDGAREPAFEAALGEPPAIASAPPPLSRKQVRQLAKEQLRSMRQKGQST